MTWMVTPVLTYQESDHSLNIFSSWGRSSCRVCFWDLWSYPNTVWQEHGPCWCWDGWPKFWWEERMRYFWAGMTTNKTESRHTHGFYLPKTQTHHTSSIRFVCRTSSTWSVSWTRCCGSRRSLSHFAGIWRITTKRIPRNSRSPKSWLVFLKVSEVIKCKTYAAIFPLGWHTYTAQVSEKHPGTHQQVGLAVRHFERGDGSRWERWFRGGVPTPVCFLKSYLMLVI